MKGRLFTELDIIKDHQRHLQILYVKHKFMIPGRAPFMAFLSTG